MPISADDADRRRADLERDPRAEREAGRPQAARPDTVRGHEVERRAEVGHLARAVVERRRRSADAAEVEAQHGAADARTSPLVA